MNSTCELGDDAARALEPYQDYKTSGVQWLGKVPAHWEVAPVKQKYAIRLGKMLQPARRASDDCRISYLKAKHVQWLEVRTNDIETMWATPDEVDRYGIVAGDLLVCEGGEGGRCGIVKRGTALPDPCIIQNALHRVRPRSWGSVGDISRNDYLQYMMSTVASTGWFDVLTDKATIAHFTAEKFGALLASIPPLPEQAAIVRFLDHTNRRIRRYIRAKQKLITLLEEQKQAIIHQAVTGQVDVSTGQPYPAYKPSGVEWLGEVPKHWKILPLKRWVSTKITDGPHETPALLDDGIPFMSAESMVGGRLDFSRRRGFISREQHEVYCRKCRPRRDDIFMCKSGATTGKVAIVEIADEFSVWSPLALVRVEPHKVLARLLFAVLQTRYVQRQVQDTWSYGTQPNLAMRAMERLVVVLPPIDEQQEVIAHLDRAAKKPSEAIDRAHREIFLLREYRIRLIADVVTGKLDVRKAAARLPDKVEEPEPLDETDALIDGDEEPADDLDTTPEEATV